MLLMKISYEWVLRLLVLSCFIFVSCQFGRVESDDAARARCENAKCFVRFDSIDSGMGMAMIHIGDSLVVRLDLHSLTLYRDTNYWSLVRRAESMLPDLIASVCCSESQAQTLRYSTQPVGNDALSFIILDDLYDLPLYQDSGVIAPNRLVDCFWVRGYPCSFFSTYKDSAYIYSRRIRERLRLAPMISADLTRKSHKTAIQVGDGSYLYYDGVRGQYLRDSLYKLVESRVDDLLDEFRNAMADTTELSIGTCDGEVMIERRAMIAILLVDLYGVPCHSIFGSIWALGFECVDFCDADVIERIVGDVGPEFVDRVRKISALSK